MYKKWLTIEYISQLNEISDREMTAEQIINAVEKSRASYSFLCPTPEELWNDIKNYTYEDNNHIITVYHGSTDMELTPFYGGGADYHDYGRGFYCTKSLNSAKEWACQWWDNDCSYVYEYTLNLDKLVILDLSKKDILFSLALLAERRYESDEPKRRKERRFQFIKKYYINLNEYDIVICWRADDKYFNFLKNFLRGDLSVESTKESFILRELGLQIVIISEKAYNNLEFISRYDISGDMYTKYRSIYQEKINEANAILLKVQDLEGGSYINDLVSEVL